MPKEKKEQKEVIDKKKEKQKKEEKGGEKLSPSKDSTIDDIKKITVQSEKSEKNPKSEPETNTDQSDVYIEEIKEKKQENKIGGKKTPERGPSPLTKEEEEESKRQITNSPFQKKHTSTEAIDPGLFSNKKISKNLFQLSHSQDVPPSKQLPYRTSSSSMLPPNSKTLIIFFKVKETVKKSTFFGESLTDLNQLFAEKFPSIHNGTSSFCFYIKDQSADIWHELEDIKDLYNNAILQWHDNKAVEESIPQDVVQRKMVISAFERNKMCFVMVGLPARGKSYFGLKLTCYFNWHSVQCRIFNVGNYRRKILGSNQDHTFFDPDNVEAAKSRLHLALSCLDDMLEWLDSAPSPSVAIYDATNISRQRRDMLLKRCKQDNVKVIFVETVCTDDEILEKNIKSTKLFSPDYSGKDPEEAVRDFRNRIKQYEKVYEPCEEADGSFIRITDIGKKVVIHNINSYLPSRVVYFLMNLHNLPRNIWFCLPGQTDFDLDKRYGTEGTLTREGENFALALGNWVDKMAPTNDELAVWTGTSPYIQASSMYINYPKTPLRVLEDIDPGTCSGMTLDEFISSRENEYQELTKNPLTFRFTRGENYIDVMHRIEPLLFELERTRHSVLVIAPEAVLRCMFCYFRGQKVETIPKIEVKKHVVYELLPKSYLPDLKVHSFEDLLRNK